MAAGNEGEIRVELKLLTDKAKKKAEEFKKELAVPGPTGPRRQIGDEGTLQTLKNILLPKLPPASVRVPGVPRSSVGGLASPTGPYYRPPIPKPPIIAPPILTAPGSGPTGPGGNILSPQVLAAIGGVAGRIGLSGLSSIMRGGVIGAAIAAVVATLVGLRRAIQQTIEAYERARRLYARSLTSGGLPLGFTAHRTALAEVIGVSEKEVLSYGAAVAALNAKVKQSAKVMAETTGQLTMTSWMWQIAKKNWQALWASIAQMASPAMRVAAQGASQLASELTSLVMVLNRGRESAIRITVAMQDLLIRTFTGGPIRTMMDKFRKWRDELINKLFGSAPPPVASANRYPTSTFERQGLVMGTIQANHPATLTARNTAKTVDLLGRMITILADNKTNGFGVITTSQHNRP